MTQTEQSSKISVSFSNNLNFQFLKKSAALIRNLDSDFVRLASIMSDYKKIKEMAPEYRRLEFIKRSIAGKSENQTIAILSQNAKFFERYDGDFSKLLAQLVENKENESALIRNLLTINSPATIALNQEPIISNIGKIENYTLRSKLKGLILSITKCYEEQRVLRFCEQDLDNWDQYFHSDISFFVEKISLYFEGGLRVQNSLIKGLKEFNDDALRKNVYSAREVKMLMALAGLTHQAESQSNFLQELISFLQKDIEEGKWVRNDSMKEFFKNIERYSQKFVKDFKNEAIAKALLNNKRKIEEQPFLWIDLLQKLKAALSQWSSMKMATIQAAKQAIKSTFTERQRQLEATLDKLMQKLREILTIPSTDLKGDIERAIKRAERTIDNLWIRRRKEFKRLKNEIEAQIVVTCPELYQIVNDVSIIKEYETNKKAHELAYAYSIKKQNISSKLGAVPEIRKFTLLGMLAHTLKNRQKVEEVIEKTFESVFVKSRRLQIRDLRNLKERVNNLLVLFSKANSIYKLLDIPVEHKTEEPAKTYG